MRTHRFSKFFLLLLSATLVTAVLPVFGQEEEAPAEKEEAGLTQGQAAVIIARKLGLFSNEATAATQASAIQMLTARGVAPQGGWDAGAMLTPGELARLLVKALGLEVELAEAQIAGEDTQPYVDLLIEKYGVDVNEIATSAGVSGSVPGDSGFDKESVTGDDPLTRSFLETTTDDSEPQAIPVSQADLEATLAAIVGGSSGGTSGNMTPSAP
ncbi:hypothetical protein P0Y35_01375 [Kiritimatiellaeota bacterium B1221]|nr:hypothetical protein [Kiritimatiellaeota bacterium B1221]